MKTLLTRLFPIAVLIVSLFAPLLLHADIGTGTANVRIVADAVITDTTSSNVILPIGWRTFYGQVVCTSGACTQTQKIFGTGAATAINGILICTITLSATTRAQDSCPVTMVVFPFYYVTTTNTTGTAATGSVYVFY